MKVDLLLLFIAVLLEFSGVLRVNVGVCEHLIKTVNKAAPLCAISHGIVGAAV